MVFTSDYAECEARTCVLRVHVAVARSAAAVHARVGGDVGEAHAMSLTRLTISFTLSGLARGCNDGAESEGSRNVVYSRPE